MKTLSGLTSMNDPAIREWLIKVEKTGIPVLVDAMLGADEEVRNCIYRNMSLRAQNALQADLRKYSRKHISPAVIAGDAAKLEKLL